ncbi:MAG: pyridoxamine 5'-phosphate oxidase [Planctomycetota bacterium]
MTLELMDLPADPGQLMQEWFDDARDNSGQENHNAMMLATVDADGRPSVRTVLRKAFDPAACVVTFYTNYNSRKGRAIEANPNVAINMHWDALEKQLRIEGRAVKVSAATSDAYFATRPRESQVGAWASDQSEPLDSFGTLIGKALIVANEYAGRDIPRPPHWGGYDVTPESIEFWQGGSGRVHQRVRYGRSDGGWNAEWLNP